MSYTDTIEKAKELVRNPEWPRPIDNFPNDSDCNCWEFSHDGMKIPALQKLTWYSDMNDLINKVFKFYHSVGLDPRIISSSEEKAPEELVFLYYIFTYFDVKSEETRSECHVARIEYDGSVVEKADATEELVVTSLEEIKQRLFTERKLIVDPILIAVHKPQ